MNHRPFHNRRKAKPVILYDEYGNELCGNDDENCKKKEIDRINKMYNHKNQFPLDDESVVKNFKTGFSESDCPMFKNGEYDAILSDKEGNKFTMKVLGRGNNGLVAMAGKEGENGILMNYAIKFNLLTETDPKFASDSYNELRIQYILTDLIKDKYKIESEWTNFVKLYDWSQCKFALYNFARKRLTQEDVKKYFDLKYVEDDYEVLPYSIVLSEVCDKGSLDGIINQKRNKDKSFFEPVILSNLIVQILGTEDNLALQVGFTQGDLHPGNILAQSITQKNNPHEYEYLGYTYHTKGVESKIYASINGSGDMLFKIADFGLSFIEIQSSTSDDPLLKIAGSEWVTQDYMVEGYPDNLLKKDNFEWFGTPKKGVAPQRHAISDDIKPNKTNIAFDLHKFSVFLIRQLFTDYDTYKTISPYQFLICFELLFPMVHNNWRGPINKEWYNRIKKVLVFFRKEAKEQKLCGSKPYNVQNLYSADVDLIQKYNKRFEDLDDDDEFDELEEDILKISQAVNDFGLMYFNPETLEARKETGWYFQVAELKEWFNRWKTEPLKSKDMTLTADLSVLDYQFSKSGLPISLHEESKLTKKEIHTYITRTTKKVTKGPKDQIGKPILMSKDEFERLVEENIKRRNRIPSVEY